MKKMKINMLVIYGWEESVMHVSLMLAKFSEFLQII